MGSATHWFKLSKKSLLPDLALLQEVDETAGCGGQEVHPGRQSGQLAASGHAAVGQPTRQPRAGGELPRLVVDLDGQLSGRRHNQTAWPTRNNKKVSNVCPLIVSNK
jgi:hypothetical protein